jgi:hypothetical protein
VCSFYWTQENNNYFENLIFGGFSHFSAENLCAFNIKFLTRRTSFFVEKLFIASFCVPKCGYRMVFYVRACPLIFCFCYFGILSCLVSTVQSRQFFDSTLPEPLSDLKKWIRCRYLIDITVWMSSLLYSVLYGYSPNLLIE